jgi:HK97 family phage portal protein
MGLLSIFRRSAAPEQESRSEIIHADAPAMMFSGLDDPRLIEFMQNLGAESDSGITVTLEKAMRNTAVFRSVALISTAIGMLPLHLIDKETKQKASDHPLFPVLHRRPNVRHTAYQFRQLMQLRLLVKGNAFAQIVRVRDTTRSRSKIIGLIPLDPDKITIKENGDYTLSYELRTSNNGKRMFSQDDVFHLRNLSMDGTTGLSLVQQAANSIGLALAADLALSRLYRNGSFVNGVLKSPNRLGSSALQRLKESWGQRYSGAGNAGGTPILEQGLDYQAIGPNARDAQSNETRGRQVEEIARIFGVPRPLLMVDETSWGSGIDVLGQFFVRYALNPQFECWQQEIERSLLSDADVDRYEAKFNPGALLRGSMQQQGEFLARALGSGGHQPWMHVDEVRDVMDLEKREAPPNPMAVPTPANDDVAERAAAAMKKAIDEALAARAAQTETV